jgi:protein required for attachment to host cells
MEAVKIKSGDWVVVCDGRKALVLENEGDAVFPNLRTRETHEQENAKTSEQGTDRPGRVHESTGTSRSAVAQTDWHDQAESEFLQGVAKRLDDAVTKGEAQSLIIIAAPRALGVLRPAFSNQVQNVITAEISKDLVNMPVYDIEKLLTK